MRLANLASIPNLNLAWRRITTGGNHQYKVLYRHLYDTYELALDANLNDLRARILGGAFEPTHPERIYVPKPSGLHRPLALLRIEDQIVLQAFANLAAKKMQKHRVPLQFKAVFSNILERPGSKFFFRRWQTTYAAFQMRIHQHFDNGLRWVGDFDLAAFYDTISHELLMKTIYPRTTNEDLAWIGKCLIVWSSEKSISGHGHGLPQGPIASDFLAECFLIPVDKAMSGCAGYMRYVDDVRLFGGDENEVRRELIELERHCRERGLIPQTGKFAIRRARDIHDAMGMLPSIVDPQHEAGQESIARAQARDLFALAVAGRPTRVTDKTQLRYVLYRAEADPKVLKIVLRLIPRHPEHADACFFYLGKFGYRRPIEKLCLELVSQNPYPYLRGEAWHVLARYRSHGKAETAREAERLQTAALQVVKNKTQENLVERWGACHFLCASEGFSGVHLTGCLKDESPLTQALLGPVLPDAAYAKGRAVESFLRATAAEPGLSVCSGLHDRDFLLAKYGLSASDLPSQVANTMESLGIVGTLGYEIDAVSEILCKLYGLPKSKSWQAFLGAEYLHVLGLLKRAEATFLGNRTYWLMCQNSFNHAVFLALQRHLATIGHQAAVPTTNKHGALPYGSLLEANGRFQKHCPLIASCFRAMNKRRNELPDAHPYTTKLLSQTTHLRSQERNQFVSKLRLALPEVVKLMP